MTDMMSKPDFRPGALGFLTDTSLCIGCKACEVACKQWNDLPADGFAWTGFSYDNTVDLGAETWRHVTFLEREAPDRSTPIWLMMSDVCKHCLHAGCMEACPTGAIICSEFDTVVIQQDICNGCGYCIPACPFGVPALSLSNHTARKCTLCHDRLASGLEPACAKACPTDSIQFGPVDVLYDRGKQRVEVLRERGIATAQFYGDLERGGSGGIGGLNAMFVLLDEPECYNLPAAPELPQDRVLPGFVTTAVAAVAMGCGLVAALRQKR